MIPVMTSLREALDSSTAADAESLGPAAAGGWAAVESDSLVPAGSDTLDLATILHALSDPIRLLIVAKLADGQEHTCGSFGLPIAKSTSSHHFRVLREAGIVQQRIDGKCRLNRLRAEQLEQRFPGLLDAVLRANEA
jgi:DNA-binding transcriptional ArsR family regulator